MNTGPNRKNPIANAVATVAIVIFVVSFLGMFPLYFFGGGGIVLTSFGVSMFSILVFLIADRLSGRDDGGGGIGGVW